tara:strand:- start:30170 stop:31858 length:1689 start_codon:yes stop_codon:yes gene_type:complete
MSQGNPAPDASVDADPATDAAENRAPEVAAPSTDAATPAEPTATSADPAATTETSASPVESPAAPVDNQAAQARKAGPLAARGLGVAKPASPSVNVAASTDSGKKDQKPAGGSAKKKKPPRPRLSGEKDESQKPAAPAAKRPTGKVAVPSIRGNLADDIQAELDAELAAADFDAMMSGSAGMADRKEPIADGARVHGQILKIHGDSVFISLGGPDEGAIPLEQFTGEEPQVGQSVEVIVRGINSSDGLYSLGLPGAAVEASDWEDIDEGSVVEVTVTGHNTGGLECKLGGVRGFIPISQVAEHRVEDLSEFVDQKMTCVVTEANERRGNLVLSRRAILEREKEEKRKEQLEKIQVGDVMEGIVRSVKDFGAFVDLGGCDGLIHVSKLSWDRVKHPSEVLEVGQKVEVKIDRFDKETGKIGLSYRDLQDNPWDTAEAEFAVGTITKGTVSKIADFGCFVRLAAGVEGLVHISELAHHRVSRVSTFVSEGQEVDVKVLSFDRDKQKISLSIKAVTAAPADAKKSQAEEEVDEPQREPAIKAQHTGPLKGGNNTDSGGERFGLRW